MMMMVLYRDCYRDVVTTTSPVLPESPRTGAAAAAGTEVPASGAAGGWMLSRRREEAAASPHTGRGLHAGRTTAARRSRYFAVYTDTGLGGQISALDLEA